MLWWAFARIFDSSMISSYLQRLRFLLKWCEKNIRIQSSKERLRLVVGFHFLLFPSSIRSHDISPWYTMAGLFVDSPSQSSSIGNLTHPNRNLWWLSEIMRLPLSKSSISMRYSLINHQSSSFLCDFSLTSKPSSDLGVLGGSSHLLSGL